MKRYSFSLSQIADYNNLQLALYKAARAKRQRSEVRQFCHEAEIRLNRLSHHIRHGFLPYGQYRNFNIYDPKPRVIHAACFADRVFHHALMNYLGPVLEKAMHYSSYACLPGRGVHAAVLEVQRHLRRFPYYVKMDIAGFFAAIQHDLLMQCLQQKFKGRELYNQLQRVLAAPPFGHGQGLPIGALTSQYFANYFLDGLDRLLAANPNVRAHIRYMDDIVWWCDQRQTAMQCLEQVKQWLQLKQLNIKNNIQCQASNKGISYCGYRIDRGRIRLSRRKRRRYQQRRNYWERQYQEGKISSVQLQAAYSAVHSICAYADSRGWRQKNLLIHPSIEI